MNVPKTFWVAQAEWLPQKFFPVHSSFCTSQQPWGLSWFGQENPGAPGAWGRGSRRRCGAEGVDGHLQGAVRWEGKVCLSEKLAAVPVSAPGVC